MTWTWSPLGERGTAEGERRRTAAAWAVLAVLVAAKLWLTRAQPVFAIGDAFGDDRLFLMMAERLLRGEWLGSYNEVTLAKGMFFPLWTAAVYVLNLPLLLAEQLFYALAVGLFIRALGPLGLPRPWKLLGFAFLLFNPLTFTESALRTQREGIYHSLSLLVLAGAIGLVSRHAIGRTRRAAAWALGLGAAWAAFSLTREEGVWLLPSLALIFAGGLATTWRRWRTGLWLCALAALPAAAGPLAVAAVNRAHYGVFTTVEFKSPEFLDAYGALCRVKHARWRPEIPVPAETRERIYPLSPAFAELRPFLEGANGRRWLATLHADEIAGGWFMWLLREAVREAGHAHNGAEAAGFYRRLAREVNAACEAGKIACYPKRSGMMPPWHSENLPALLRAAGTGLRMVVRCEGLKVRPWGSVGDESLLALFRTLTRERLARAPGYLETVRGWAFRPGGTVSLKAGDEQGRELPVLVMERLASPDLLARYRDLGITAPSASAARFQVRNLTLRGLRLWARSGGESVEIPLDSSRLVGRQGEIYYGLETLDNGRAPEDERWDEFRLRLLERLGRFYQLVLPALAVLGLAVWLAAGLRRGGWARGRWIGQGILLALLAGVAVRILLLSLITVTSFPALGTLYLSSAYPLWLAAIFLALAGWVVRPLAMPAADEPGAAPGDPADSSRPGSG